MDARQRAARESVRFEMCQLFASRSFKPVRRRRRRVHSELMAVRHFRATWCRRNITRSQASNAWHPLVCVQTQADKREQRRPAPRVVTDRYGDKLRAMSSQWDDLQKALAEARAFRHRRRQQCVNLVAALIQVLKERWQIPKHDHDVIALYRLDAEPLGEKQMPVHQVAFTAGDDGLLHVGLGLSIPEVSRDRPPYKTVLDLSFEEIGETAYRIRFSEDADGVTVDANDRGTLIDFADQIFKALMKHMSTPETSSDRIREPN